MIKRFFFETQGPSDHCSEQQEIDRKAGEEGHTQIVYKEHIKLTGRLHGILYNAYLYQAGNQATCNKGDDRTFGSYLVTTVKIDHHDSGYGQQVQQVDSNGKSHHKEEEHDPAVAGRSCLGIIAGMFICMFPFQYTPEYEGGKERG